VVDVRIISVSSSSVTVSWSALECDERNGPAVGYSYNLTHRHSLEISQDVGTSQDVRTSDAVGTSHHGMTNETQVQLSGLRPFSLYKFAVSFTNSDFDGPKTIVNFTTHEDGLSYLDFSLCRT